MQSTELAVAHRFPMGEGAIAFVAAATPAGSVQVVAAAAEARRRVERGEAIDLLPLVREVAATIKRVAETGSAAERVGLMALQDELDRLLTAVQREHASARQSLSELVARERAGRAYAKRA